MNANANHALSFLDATVIGARAIFYDDASRNFVITTEARLIHLSAQLFEGEAGSESTIYGRWCQDIDNDDIEVDDDRITDLRTEAAVAGDLAQVDICEAALAGDPAAQMKCARVIANALAMDDGE